jgi:hypothetical protein
VLLDILCAQRHERMPYERWLRLAYRLSVESATELRDIEKVPSGSAEHRRSMQCHWLIRTLRQHSAAGSLLKVPSQRTAVILADPAACSRRCLDRARPDLGRSAYGPASEPGGREREREN